MGNVVLRQTWEWTCPSCHHSNYHSGNKVKNPEDIEELKEIDEREKELFGDFGEPAGEWVMLPEKVFCAKCEDQHIVLLEESD